MTTTDAVVAKLQKLGLNAEAGHAVPEIFVWVNGDEGHALYLSRNFNRSDGGWEGVLDYGGAQVPLQDGPLGDALPRDVRDWVVQLLVEVAALHARSLCTELA